LYEELAEDDRVVSDYISRTFAKGMCMVLEFTLSHGKASRWTPGGLQYRVTSDKLNH